MLRFLLRALIFWVGMFEIAASWRGLRGLSWLRGWRGYRLLLPLPLAALLGMRSGRRWRYAGLALMALPALLLQLGAASRRNRAIDPLLRMRPGRHADRDVAAVRIPMREGYLPGLELVPRAGARAAVCVLHGSGDHKTSYTWWLADALMAQGLAVLLVDMDGHGENPRVQRFPEMLEDVQAAGLWLRERYARVGVLGISLGGCVAARAVADGAPVDALVVLEAPPTLEYTRADMRREALALAQPRLLQLFRDCTLEQLIGTWSTAPIRAAISTWDLIAALDLLGSLPRLQPPMLLMYGARDAIIKPPQAERVRLATPAGARFCMVPGASHLTLTLDPAVLREIGVWLAARLG